MNVEQSVKDLCRRVNDLETKYDELNDKISKQDVVDAELKKDIVRISGEVKTMKTDVLTILNKHTDKTWSLIERCVKVIVLLIAIVTIMAGVKLAPEILGLF